MNLYSDLKQIRYVSTFELSRKVRNWKIIIPIMSAVIVLFMAYLNGMNAMNGNYSDVGVNDFIRPFVASATLVIAICAATLSSEDLSTEFENNTGYVIFTKPISRSVLFLGKFISCLLTSMAILLFYYLITAVLTINVAGHVPEEFFHSILLAILFLISVTGVCMLFSSISPRGSIALIVSFILLVTLPIFLQNVSFSSEPWFSLGYSSGIVGDYALNNQTIFITDGVGHISTNDYVPSLILSIIVMAAYGIFSILLAATIFKHRHI